MLNMYDQQNQPDQPEQEEDQKRKQLALLRKTQQGANWFFWIAVISLVNILLFLSGKSISIVIGLGATNIVTYLATEHNTTSYTAIVVTITIILLAIFILCGYYGRKVNLKAFMVGMAIYFADAILLLLIMDWISIVFHIVILIFIFLGFQAARKYNRLQTPTIIS